MTDPFNLDEQFEFYLKLVEFPVDYWAERDPLRMTEIKRAFMGAWGQFLTVLSEQIPQLDEDVIDSKLLSMRQQIINFWQQEHNRQN
jgi:hypothetical protein